MQELSGLIPLILYTILRETGGVHTELWWGDQMERDYLEDGRVLLKWIVQKWDEGAWTGLIWRRIGTGGGLCKCGDGLSGSIKCGRFRD
jgi:hypothetical protein